MKIYTLNKLSKQQIEQLNQRSLEDDGIIEKRADKIISEVKNKGDLFLRKCNADFDGYSGDALYLDSDALKKLASQISEPLRSAIDVAAANIEKFHSAQLKSEAVVETTPGVTCWRENRAIEKVGIYVPGGSAVLPSTFLMLAIPAQIAGCGEIVVCTPPNALGLVDVSIAYCAEKLGIDKVYLAGGAQAIAAMAFGTETVPRVYKIFGPGNRYVMNAKSLLLKQVAIDLPAGPSEVLIIADQQSNPEFLAADLLAQAEHGADSQVVLISNSINTLLRTKYALDQQLPALPRREIAEQALKNSFMLEVDDLDQAVGFSNQYAPEHLILALHNACDFIPKIVNAGSVFLGNLTPESAGDYASGTNHTLPTSGFAKAYSGVSVDSFIKKITFQALSVEGLQNIGPAIQEIAMAEGLYAHKNAVSIRLKENGY